MPSSFAPGKIILFGEHAVVYGQPAIAVPVMQVGVRVHVEPRQSGQRIRAPAVNLDADLSELPAGDPLSAALRAVQAALKRAELPGFELGVQSTIPLAAGLGSGAAVSVALIRAFSTFLGQPLPDEQVNALAYEIEKIHHGTPSGIDNTVITYARPVYYTRGQPIRTLTVAAPFTIVIADTGIPSPTAAAVSDVRAAWRADKPRYERLFSAVGGIVRQARQAIENGQPQALGPLMNQNHALLREIGVSSPELDRLVNAAQQAGAWGAKLSGGGRGGNMIALASPERAPQLAHTLQAAGAARTIVTRVDEHTA